MWRTYESIPRWTTLEGRLIPSVASSWTSDSEMIPPHMLHPCGAGFVKSLGS